jgi:pyocin large subunit-like protein
MSRRAALRIAALSGLVAVLALWFGLSATGPSAVAAPPIAEAPAGTSIGHPEIGFSNPAHLAEHFQKHGREFGAISQAEYLHRAQSLRDRPAVGPVREAVRQDGVVTRFDRSEGDFLAFDSDLTIRTYFRPNNGEAYFDRQLQRGRSFP